jgi:hypothetical protein
MAVSITNTEIQNVPKVVPINWLIGLPPILVITNGCIPHAMAGTNPISMLILTFN